MLNSIQSANRNNYNPNFGINIQRVQNKKAATTMRMFIRSLDDAQLVSLTDVMQRVKPSQANVSIKLVTEPRYRKYDYIFLYTKKGGCADKKVMVRKDCGEMIKSQFDDLVNFLRDVTNLRLVLSENHVMPKGATKKTLQKGLIREFVLDA